VKSKLLADLENEKSWVIVFETQDEVMTGLLSFAVAQSVSAAHFTAIGAFSRAVLGYFDWKIKEYSRITVDEQVEVVTLMGDVVLQGQKPKVHAHATLAKRGGVTVGGHLLEGFVRPTLEVVLTQVTEHLERHFDEASGIALIRL
jgi:predicted DNA-binding protein with PD1-like motif